ncbi:MAG: Gfo/Idh/MocA family protein [Thermodesulfobacteriota bacterium]
MDYRPPRPNRYRPRIGLIGCGGITIQHLKAYRQAGYDVVGLCDLDRERAKARQREHFPDATVHTDAGDLLARSDVDVVDLATHPQPRAQLLLDAIAAGKHVLSQKPFVFDLDHGQRVVEAAAKQGVKVAVNQNGRWAPHVAWMRAAIGHGLIGEVLSVDTSVYWDHNWCAATPFDRIPHLVLYDFAIHWFDMLHCYTRGLKPRQVPQHHPHQIQGIHLPFGGSRKLPGHIKGLEVVGIVFQRPRRPGPEVGIGVPEILNESVRRIGFESHRLVFHPELKALFQFCEKKAFRRRGLFRAAEGQIRNTPVAEPAAPFLIGGPDRHQQPGIPAFGPLEKPLQVPEPTVGRLPHRTVHLIRQKGHIIRDAVKIIGMILQMMENPLSGSRTKPSPNRFAEQPSGTIEFGGDIRHPVGDMGCVFFTGGQVVFLKISVQPHGGGFRVHGFGKAVDLEDRIGFPKIDVEKFHQAEDR